ncbi:TPA: response regulator, partial [Candidatus Poribacteria bacterium]|nr:response regulator [Candidatus Poribacteria bacterium]
MNHGLRVLLIEDNPDDRFLTIRELQREFGRVEVEQITDRRGFEQALESGEFDVVITDYQLRWGNGLEVLREIKKRNPYMPVIMFTGTGNEEIAVEAMKSGLDDYVIKSPIHLKRL